MFRHSYFVFELFNVYILEQGDASFNSILSICKGQMLICGKTEVVSKRPITNHT